MCFCTIPSNGHTSLSTALVTDLETRRPRLSHRNLRPVIHLQIGHYGDHRLDNELLDLVTQLFDIVTELPEITQHTTHCTLRSILIRLGVEVILAAFVQRVVRQMHVSLAHVPRRRGFIRNRAEASETLARYVDLEWIETGDDDVDAQVEL